MRDWETGLGALALLAAGTAGAQTPAPSPASPPGGEDGVQPAGEPGRASGRRSFDAAFFAQFSPSSALQIVERVPGFAIQDVDPSVRGFAQTAGNVVINGQRPSIKSDTIETILGRIPANRVLRVEVGPGDLYGADYAGKSQVLNLVLTAAGGATTNLEVGARRDFTGKLFPQGSVSTLLRKGPSTFNASLTVRNEATTEEGYDRVTALPSGDLVEFRRKTNRIEEPTGTVSASWDYNGGANRTAHVNVRTAIDRFALTQSNHVMPAEGDERDDRLTQRYLTREVELGGDVTRPLAGGAIKVVALGTRRYRDFRDVSLFRADGGELVLGGNAQRLKSTYGETLARLTWSRSGWNGWSVEAGAEGVNNRLDSDTVLTELNADGTSTPIDLPIAQAVVEEWRGEAFVNAGHALTADLRADGSLTYEASRLTVSGDATAERTLTFLKRLVLDWKLGAWRAQATVQRTVAQLQFEDFVGNAELANDRVNGGNANLVPQRAWESLVTLERPILKDGLFRLEAGYNRVSLVQDRIPTEDGFDAPGNLGDGSVWILRSRIEAPMSRFGLKGVRAILYGSYVKSRVEDPYTHEQRAFSGNSDFYGEATIRQDLTHLAWGVTLEGGTSSTFFRLNELDTSRNGFPYLTAFVEWRPNLRTTLNLTLDNAAGIPASRERTFFFPSRSTPDPDLFEYRVRDKHVVPMLTFKKTIG